MAQNKLVLSFVCILALSAPRLAAAEIPNEHLVTTTTPLHIPPGCTYVQKWALEQIPGRLFETRADAIAAGFNASLMRMDLHQVTIIIQPSDSALALRQ